MLVDEKGRLFKKINVLDLIIVVIIIAAGIFVFKKFSNAGLKTIFTNTDKVSVQFYVEDCPRYLGESIKVGQTAKDKITNSNFGKVTDVEIGPSIVFAANSEGQIVSSSRPGYVSLIITVEGEGILSDMGVTFDNIDYYVWKYVELRVGDNFVVTRVKSIEKK
jgi:hypothetical protein